MPHNLTKVRIQPRLDPEVVKLAKIKALQTDQTLEQAVEALLRAWVSGRLKIVSDKGGRRPE